MSRPDALRIATDLALPLDAATETFAVLGKRGSGKSNTAVVLFEEMHAAGIPCVAVDPKGDWWGVRSAADGKGPGLPVPVFGGRHGDVPLEPTAGGYLADLVIERRLSCVVDVSELSRADVVRFLTAFGQRVYRQADAEPLHLFLEECHEYLPQQRGEPGLLAAWQRIVRQGRFKGIGCTLVSQRSAAVNKDVLNQAEVLVAMRVLAPHDRAAIKGWVEVHGDAAEVLASLHLLADGEGWVWAPDLLGDPVRVRFRRRATFDSGATPKVGQRRREPTTLADVDLVAVKEAMAESIERAKADDPVELRRRIARLERELRSLRNAKHETPPVVERVVEVPALGPDAMARLAAVVDVAGDVAALRQDVEALMATLAKRPSPEPATSRGTGRLVPRPEPQGAAPPPAVEAPNQDVRVGKRERLILSVLAQYPQGRSHRQLALLTGYRAKASTIGAGLSMLRKAGYVEPSGDPVRATPLGLEAIVGQVEPLPTGEALLAYWRGQLGKRERLILDVLVQAWPGAVDHATICEATGYSPEASTVGAGLSKLRALELVDGWALSADFAAATGLA
jgi:uncharacterized protein